MPEPQRRSPARKPTVLKMRKYLVRLWEVERKRGSKPSQIKGFDVEANAVHKARDAVKLTLANTHRRVVRSLSMTTDGVFTAIVFKNEIRIETPTKLNEFPLRRDGAAESVAIAAARAARRVKAKPDLEALRKKKDEEKTKANAERRLAVAKARKKQVTAADKRRAEKATEHKLAVKARDKKIAERDAKRHEAEQALAKAVVARSSQARDAKREAANEANAKRKLADPAWVARRGQRERAAAAGARG